MLKDANDIEKFDLMIQKYIESYRQLSFPFISLGSVYKSLEKWDEKDRLFSMLVDIKINLVLIYLDMCAITGIWNMWFAKGKLEGGSVLECPLRFRYKMDIHNHMSSMVFRYRAIWDKIMNFTVLYYLPDKFPAFDKAKSRKRSFRRIMVAYNEEIYNICFKDLLDEIDKFDSEYRTSEAHGAGSLRKYTFEMQYPNKDPNLEMIGYWNYLNGYISRLEKVLKSNADVGPV